MILVGLPFRTTLLVIFLCVMFVLSAHVFGEDVGFSGVFHCTTGLADQFGESRSGLGEFLCSLFHFYLFEASIFDVVVPCFNLNSSI